MNGAIFYASRYGSTAQYARWLRDATRLPAFDIAGPGANPSEYDFLVLGSPIVYHKLMFHKWVKRNLSDIMARPAILFSVSGAGPGPKLDGWIARSLPADLVSHLTHVALRGRQNPKELGWYDRMMLILGGLMNPDPVARNEELTGFDFMDKSSIEPIVAMVARFRREAASAS